MAGGYGTVYWEEPRVISARVTSLKVVVPMPIANSNFGIGVILSTITIHRRPESQPSLAQNDFILFNNMEVVSKRNLHLGTFKIPSSVLTKVGGWSGQNDTRMFVPTIVLLKASER